MKAAVVEELGRMVVKEMPDPELLDEGLLIKVECCAICGSDIRIYKKGDKRATYPRIIGHEITGTVVGVGRKVSGFKEGDRICVAPGQGCGKCKYCKNGMGNVCINPIPSIGYASNGGFAQFICPPTNVVKNGFVNKIPDEISFEEASISELLACCINGQERSRVSKDDNVVIIGAGPAGCMHIELAKKRGAAKVIIAQRSLTRIELAERFGPDVIINTSKEDIVLRVKEETNGLGADVVIVAAPSKEAQELSLQMIAPRGRINFFGGLPKNDSIIHIDANIIHYIECELTGASSSLARQNKEALKLIGDGIIDAQKYITHIFSIDDIVEAFKVVENHEGIKVIVKPWE